MPICSKQLNHNLAAVTSLLADDPNKVGQAVEDLNAVVVDVQDFAADNAEAIGTASDTMASITRVLVESLDDIKQTLHIAPTVLQNFNNIYEPAQRFTDRRAGHQQLRKPGLLPVWCNSVRIPSGRRAIGETVRAVFGAHREEPPIQLPAVGREPLRRRAGPAQRSHLQRALDAARLRSAAPPIRRRASPLAAEASAPDAAFTAARATDPTDGLPGMMVPPGGGP